jgi:hypothetical protein
MSKQKLPVAARDGADDNLDIEVLLRLLPVCGTLAGLCLAGLAYLEVAVPEAVMNTYADESPWPHRLPVPDRYLSDRLGTSTTGLDSSGVPLSISRFGTGDTPYDVVTFVTGLVAGSFDPATDAGTWQGYTELNGAGALWTTASLNLSGFGNLTAGVTDRIFSMVLSVTAGSIIVDPSANGNVGLLNTGRIDPLPPSIAEPSTVALLVLGIAGIVLLRRKQH